MSDEPTTDYIKSFVKEYCDDHRYAPGPMMFESILQEFGWRLWQSLDTCAESFGATYEVQDEMHDAALGMLGGKPQRHTKGAKQ